MICVNFSYISLSLSLSLSLSIFQLFLYPSNPNGFSEFICFNCYLIQFKVHIDSFFDWICRFGLKSSDPLLFYRNKTLGINEELDDGEFVWVGAAQSSQWETFFLFLTNSINDINQSAFKRCIEMLVAINCVGTLVLEEKKNNNIHIVINFLTNSIQFYCWVCVR